MPSKQAALFYDKRDVTVRAGGQRWIVEFSNVTELSEALSRIKTSKQYLAYLKKAGLA